MPSENLKWVDTPTGRFHVGCAGVVSITKADTGRGLTGFYDVICVEDQSGAWAEYPAHKCEAWGGDDSDEDAPAE